MAIIIDGYNLLNVTGLSGQGRGTPLARLRRALLNFLVRNLTDDERTGTIVVFDSKDAPPGLPHQEEHSGIVAMYAKDYDEADDLIEVLIDADSSPRQLLVVSSDHRIHRAARRRKATAIDSDVWLNWLESRQDQGVASTTQSRKPRMTPAEAEHWLAEFSDIDVASLAAELEPSGDPEIPDAAPASREQKKPVPPPAKPGEVDEDPLEGNPFPAGYAEDLLAGDADPDLNPFPPGYGEDLLGEEGDGKS